MDFLIIQQGKSLVLEVDGSHHSEAEQTIRDYAKDRVLLRAGVPTIRFTAKDSLNQPSHVVAEALAIAKSL